MNGDGTAHSKLHQSWDLVPSEVHNSEFSNLIHTSVKYNMDLNRKVTEGSNMKLWKSLVYQVVSK